MPKTRSDEKIRYAVVGGGPFTQGQLLPAFERAKNCELSALVMADEQKRSILGRRHAVGVLGNLDELERVLEQSRAQAVYLCTPTAQHRALTERAARAGVHVLCDTPMAETVEDCQAMASCCKARKVKLMLAYRLHFDEPSIDAIALVRSGRIGAPRVVSSLLTRPPRKGRTPRPGTATLWELCVHPINTARHLFGSEPLRVFATAGRRPLGASDVDATLSAILSFEEDACAQLTVSLAASAVATCRVVGEKGNLLIEPAYALDEPHEHVLTIGDNHIERRFPASDQLAAQLSAFSRAILENVDPSPGASEGLADVRVLEALRESVATGRSVELSHAPLGHLRAL